MLAGNVYQNETAPISNHTQKQSKKWPLLNVPALPSTALTCESPRVWLLTRARGTGHRYRSLAAPGMGPSSWGPVVPQGACTPPRVWVLGPLLPLQGEENSTFQTEHINRHLSQLPQQSQTPSHSPTGGAATGAAPDLFHGPDILSPLTRMISPSSPTSSFSYSSSSFSSLAKRGPHQQYS